MKWILLILTLTIFVSCSGSKKASDAGEELAGIELNDSEETASAEDLFADDEQLDLQEGAGEAVAEEAPIAQEPATEENLFAEETPVAEEPMAAPAATEEVAAAEPMPMAEEPAMEMSNTTEIDAAGTIKTYTVQKNETLMMIAFKIYGDYDKWREIANQNPGVDSRRLAAGQELKYMAPASEFNWNPQGSPYLIKWGDTLGLISGNVYGTQNRWKDIWNNNKPLIKDPNKIFAGFTIYYIEGEREVASR